MSNQWDWNHFIPVWDFPRLSARWQKVNHTDCPFVSLAMKRGYVDSRKIAIEFDDIATGKCYYRDWTESGLPFVNEGETYQSGFWFEKLSDAQEFQKRYGGMGNW